MRPQPILSYEFVDYIPDDLKDGTLYISVEFATAVHKCICGCGREVVTPLSPTDWKLIFDGQTISLDPSIGNWSFPCQSHYWIRANRVVWASPWDKSEITNGRIADMEAKERFFKNEDVARSWTAAEIDKKSDHPRETESIWAKIRKWLL